MEAMPKFRHVPHTGSCCPKMKCPKWWKLCPEYRKLCPNYIVSRMMEAVPNMLGAVPQNERVPNDGSCDPNVGSCALVTPCPKWWKLCPNCWPHVLMNKNLNKMLEDLPMSRNISIPSKMNAIWWKSYTNSFSDCSNHAPTTRNCAPNARCPKCWRICPTAAGFAQDDGISTQWLAILRSHQNWMNS